MAKGIEQKTSENKEEKKISKLVGCSIVLDPTQGGMFVDNINKFNLSFFEDKEGKVNDRIVVNETMDLTVIKKGISFGILRVLKDDKDITTDLGGPVKTDKRFVPVVSDAIKDITKKDDSLLNYINHNNVDKIITDIMTLKNYEALSRLKDLEEVGSNPSSAPRGRVIDAISLAIKNCSGIKFENDKSKDEVITLK